MRAGETPYAVKRAAAGLGLFATKPIPKGTKIIEYVGPRISNAEVEKSNGKYYFGLNKQWSIDGSGRENVARYANHSCGPNAEAIITCGRIWICSRRNIKAGEEITYNYGKEYFEGIIKDIGCKCPKCQPRSHQNLSPRAAKKKRAAKQESRTQPQATA
ncbi:MAG TPA: SET domain-containing protein [Pyrinomonadaceae bacterium]|nr:SET domain-containing protein [Pyrinomonadaceae bacterium]